MSQPMTLPFDLTGSQEQLDQKRQLAEMLMQQARTPQQGQMVSGHYVSPGLLGAVSPIINALLAKKMQDEVQTGGAELRSKYNSMLADGMEKYFATREGASAVPMVGPLPADPTNPEMGQISGNLTEAVAPDPRKAAIQALTSGIGPLQQLGQMDLQSIGKNSLTPIEILKLAGEGKFTPESTVAAATSLNPHQLKGDPKKEDSWTDPYEMNVGGRPLLVRRNLKNNEVVAISGGQTINIDTQGDKAAIENSAKLLGPLREQMQTSRGMIETGNRIMQLSKDPQVIQGFGAGIGTGVASLAAKLGFAGPDAAAKTQALMKDMATNALDAGQKMKGSFSDADILFLKEASAGNINLTPEAIQHAAGLAMMAGHNTLMDSMTQFEAVKKTPGTEALANQYPRPRLGRYSLPKDLFDVDEGNYATFRSPLQSTPAAPGIPAPTGKTPAGVMSVQEWLNR